MPYDIDLSRSLAVLIEELPPGTQTALYLTLAQLAELADVWPAGDPRWERFGRPHPDGLTFYVDGCCVRVRFQMKTRRLGIDQIGRVLVHLPATEPLTARSQTVASPAEQ